MVTAIPPARCPFWHFKKECRCDLTAISIPKRQPFDSLPSLNGPSAVGTTGSRGLGEADRGLTTRQ